MKNNIILTLCIFLSLVLAGCEKSPSSSLTPSEVVKAYCAAIDGGYLEKANSLCVTGFTNDGYNNIQVIEIVKSVWSKGAFLVKSIKHEEIHGDIATIALFHRGDPDDSETYAETKFYLVKENGAWKVRKFE